MNALKPRHSPAPPAGASLQPAGPLWRQVPVRDARGRPLSDFMLLLPGVRGRRAQRELWAAQLQAVLGEFGERVAFADLNLRLGLLWVSVQAEPGLNAEVALAIQRRLPGARLVGAQFAPPRRRAARLLARVRALLR